MRAIGRVVLLTMLMATPAGAVPPLECTTCDRPDLPDYDPLGFVLPLYPFAVGALSFTGYSSGRLYADQDHPQGAWGFRYVFGAATKTMIWYELFEPDKIQRQASKTSLSQSNQVAIGFYHYSDVGALTYSYSYPASPAEGCKGSLSYDENKLDAKWKIECGKLGELLDQLGVVSSFPRNFIAAVLESSTTKKLKIQGAN